MFHWIRFELVNPGVSDIIRMDGLMETQESVDYMISDIVHTLDSLPTEMIYYNSS